jgi:hypothetical protein
MARILITGGAGFIGSHLCERFLADGDDVICMDNLLTGSLDNIAHIQDPRFTFVQHDVTNFISVKGDVDYVLHFASPASPIDYLERVEKQSRFHPLIEAGALTHIWLGEAKPSKSSLANFVVKTFRLTQNDQIAFSPEFTTCNDCHRTIRGLQSSCTYCGSEDVDGITRITGYFTKISSWNKGKIGELRNRYRNPTFLGEKEEGAALEVG